LIASSPALHCEGLIGGCGQPKRNGVRERFTKLLQSRLLRPWLMTRSEHWVGSPRLHGDVLSGAGRCRHGALTRGLLKRPIRLTSPLTPDAQRTY
jgi:hypothetical protein